MKRKVFLAFISPSVIVMTVMMVIPLAAAVLLSFNYITYVNLNEPRFVGFRNYTEILGDPAFWKSFRFTLVFILVTVPAELILGFIIALLIDQVGHGRGIYIAAILIPFIITPVVGTLMYRSMFDRGGLYYFLLERLFGYEFILTTGTVRFLILSHGIWYVTPFAVISLFAGLQTLPVQTMEAATMDGANAARKIWNVVLPHLRTVIIFITLIGIMDAYRVFDSILVMSRSNPIFDVDTVMYYSFKVATSVRRLGMANAVSVITVIGILVVLIPFLVVTHKQQKESR